MSTTFFTSDSHHHHRNIIEYSKRPFDSVEEMNEALIENWNSVVTDKDVVWHLGDFSFGTKEETAVIIRRLKGHKHFIRGNHDKPVEGNEHLFESVQDYKRIKIDGQYIIMCHYPLLSWHGAHRGSWHLHGHTHGSINYLNTNTTRLDVGVDNFAYTPVSFEDVYEMLKLKTYEIVDHHKT